MNTNFKTILFFVLILAISSKAVKKQMGDEMPSQMENNMPSNHTQDDSHFNLEDAALKHFMLNSKLELEDFISAAQNLCREARTRVPGRDELKQVFEMFNFDGDNKMTLTDFTSLIDHVKSDIERDTKRNTNLLQKKQINLKALVGKFKTTLKNY